MILGFKDRDAAAIWQGYGARLAALRGDRRGQYSVRINDQWRVCLRWTARGPTDVEIVDYHS